MPNTLNSVASKFTTRLDNVVEAASVTSDLNINGDLVGEVNGNGEVKIAKLSMQGLADYNRADGFKSGDITMNWETVKLAHDRGREFAIDVMDDEEREMIVSANIMAEFARTEVVPEVDATRFAALAKAADSAKVEAELNAADAALDAVLAGEEHMEGLGVNLAECILYVSPKVKTLLRKAQSWRISNGDGQVDTNLTMFDSMKMVTVPAGRFYTAIDLKNDAAGGFGKKATEGKDINFMIVHPSCCQAIQKHEKLRYFAPDVNQKKDAHLWQYRLFHDLFVFENKKGLIYLHDAGK